MSLVRLCVARPGLYARVGRRSLRKTIDRFNGPPVGLTLKAGDWLVCDIFSRWPEPVAAELASFTLPITSQSELHSLIGCALAPPQALVAFELTAAVQRAYKAHWKFERVALGVDWRSSLVDGPYAQMDIVRFSVQRHG